MMCLVVVSCPEVSKIVPGDLFIGAILALPDGVHSQVIRYQKHLVRASLPPVEFSFFFKILCNGCCFLDKLAYCSLDMFGVL